MAPLKRHDLAAQICGVQTAAHVRGEYASAARSESSYGELVRTPAALKCYRGTSRYMIPVSVLCSKRQGRPEREQRDEEEASEAKREAEYPGGHPENAAPRQEEAGRGRRCRWAGKMGSIHPSSGVWTQGLTIGNWDWSRDT